MRQKIEIAQKVEQVLLSFNHPEMPNEKPKFTLHVEGAEAWSFANINPSWKFDEQARSINPFNELNSGE